MTGLWDSFLFPPRSFYQCKKGLRGLGPFEFPIRFPSLFERSRKIAEDALRRLSFENNFFDLFEQFLQNILRDLLAFFLERIDDPIAKLLTGFDRVVLFFGYLLLHHLNDRLSKLQERSDGVRREVIHGDLEAARLEPNNILRQRPRY